MIQSKKATVASIKTRSNKLIEITVNIDGVVQDAVVYPSLTGPVDVGDPILLNITAVALGLGSGGRHIVIANLKRPEKQFAVKQGHIVKLNYTPMQCRNLSVEEENSPNRSKIDAFDSLDGMPVIVGGLHSMLAPIVATIRRTLTNKVRIAYLMSDAACLPAAFSHTINELQEKKLIDGVITYGHAFGGDYEAVNKYSALVAAKQVVQADITIVTMGVGSIGTGTRFGFSAIEQGEIINAAGTLGGTPIGALRLSFADERDRHRGVSHHCLTSLGQVALLRSVVPVPELPAEEARLVRFQLKREGVLAKHQVVNYDGSAVFEALSAHGLDVKTMGRGPDKDREFFLACGAAAAAAIELAE